MITTKREANAVGGRTARACDSCMRKRARWYCAADDAFLCQGCDSSVHSANQLASRHERVRLEKGAHKAGFGSSGNTERGASPPPPAWHRGFTRKARTPRPHQKPAHNKAAFGSALISNPLPLVPEIGGSEEEEDATLDGESEEQLLYRVPVFDPFAAELCNDVTDAVAYEREETGFGGGFGVSLVREKGVVLRDEACDDDVDFDNIHEFLPSDMDLAEFAADVENLLGTGLDEDSCGIEGLGLGLLDCKEEDDMEKYCSEGRKVVKVEDEDVGSVVACQLDMALDLERETIDWNFDYELPVTEGEEEEKVELMAAKEESKLEVKREKLLSLDCEGVITAWAGKGSPWVDGARPEFNPDDAWPDFMGGYSYPYGGLGGMSHGRGGDGGREARVLRYKEKRRTRLFSKKIRYEVRKLNAEKRPRMKGRFVKRPALSFASAAAGPSSSSASFANNYLIINK